MIRIAAKQDSTGRQTSSLKLHQLLETVLPGNSEGLDESIVNSIKDVLVCLPSPVDRHGGLV